ncbi:response regulator [Phenylobacterium sp. J426]|uniref:response regulator n=1 Tax=Phenylobacterium sp. J426 TaxID=2898439 RepID=UPI002151DD5B|nr:response regulator [Phenylobacterium sp. J426]MCR5876616.1 response regulator [Phenylobacterium sp. J426]
MGSAANPAHALIIEDEALIALEIEHLLREIGYSSFDWADSPPAALAAARARRPALITADIRIIGGTGVEAVDAIHRELGEIPAVFVTANPDMVRGRPAAKVIPKPIHPRRLQEACAAA